ncbi:DUF1045 domain-containing protein [Rubinisphaera margarita]|uniref:DUF1045 domain-containing protein n=1 Tax=Rubinisphaera margarita TaxID=2909586 RepID=UPI001EE7A283|nr:DUF1045 domain-containing protein [Rubinisphaera margarita]MCG6154653.1 2'-5' RNA ligase family protein [Rubinisphaera margarita]
MSNLTTCFLALEPDETLSKSVIARKQQVRDLVGEQQFLADPPHSTLYLARYRNTGPLVSCAAHLAQSLVAPEAQLAGWHLFTDDNLTGKHTLVCGLTEASKQQLRDVQQRVVEGMAPLRDRAGTRARYDSAWARLTPQECDSIEEWGFPYVGDILQPHVTIASIDQQTWPIVWEELRSFAPLGPVVFPALCLFALDGERPVLLKRFAMRRST